MITPKQQKAKLLKDQWEQLTHAEKRALAQKQLAVELATSKTITRQQTQDEVAAARKWHEDAPMREGFKEYMAAKRRLMRG